MTDATTTNERAAKSPRQRDVRLDLFRGLAMFVIFAAHSPGNPWNDWIPARFGFSSGAELFMFCSGVASAGAFGAVFLARGWWLGAARIVRRIWEVYRAHIGLSISVIALGVVVERTFPGRDFAGAYLGPLTADPLGALFGLLTLGWMPAFLDILPVYLLILAALPVLMAARRAHPYLPHVLVGASYGAAWVLDVNLVGNPWTREPWFFNPFAWQLIFFLGFFFKLGWLPVPGLRDRRLVTAAAIFVAACVPLVFWGFLDAIAELKALNAVLLGAAEKTNLHPLRVLHFLALAYLVLSWLEPIRGRLGSGPEAVLITVGQQSLTSFLASMFLAIAGGVAFAVLGTDVLTAFVVNAVACAAIVAVARVSGWFKSEPWRKQPLEGRAQQPVIAPPTTAATTKPTVAQAATCNANPM